MESNQSASDFGLLSSSGKTNKGTAYNRAYLAPLRSAQIQPDGWISDTVGTIGFRIAFDAYGISPDCLGASAHSPVSR